MQAPRIRWASSMLAVSSLLVLSAAACGGSGGNAKSTATTLPTSTPGAAALTPTSAAATQTAIAVGAQVELIDYTDPAGRYAMKIPKGWTLQASANNDNVDVYLPGKPIAADLGLACQPNETARGLLGSDIKVNTQQGLGTIDVSQARSTQVAGVEALEVTWSGKVGDHVYVYFEGRGCAWRLTLNTYPTGGDYTIDQLRPVLDGAIHSFRFIG